MEKDVAIREWCLEKALAVNHLNADKTVAIARHFEAYILDEKKPIFAVYPEPETKSKLTTDFGISVSDKQQPRI